jgi:YesN/AraC family two-component response regulator
MRILIADDEHLARLTLHSMIEEIYPNYSIEEATNGEEFINKALIFKPHIAFVDIQMPKFSGLKAICKLKDKLPLTQWIILTGYAQFDFATEALSLGVCDYLVKPLRPSKLKVAMEKAVDQYSNKFNRQAALFEQNVRDILHGSKSSNSTVNIYKLVLFHLEKLDESQIGLLIIKFKQELAKVYDNHCDYALLKVSDNELLLVIGLKLAKEINFQIDKLSQILKMNSNLMFWIFVSKTITGSDKLLESVKRLREYGNSWLVKECFKTIEEDDDITPISLKFASNVRKIESTNSQIEKKRILDELTQDLKQLSIKDKQSAKSIYVNLQYLLTNKICDCKTDKLKTDFSKLLAVTPSLSPQIADVVNYIDEHYSEDLCIKQLSYLVGLSPNYLSAKFKSEKGKRFIDYLTEKRIEKSCFLLKNSNLFVHEIAKEVGFRDVKHFSKLFKDAMGCNPSDY